MAPGTAPGPKSLPVTISDAEGRAGSTSISLTVELPPPPLDHIVISQIYGGGGNAGATYQNDYVELYNPGTVAFDLAGWTLQYASATGTGLGRTASPSAASSRRASTSWSRSPRAARSAPPSAREHQRRAST